MKENNCKGIYSSGKCVLTQEEYEKLGLRLNGKRIICVNMVNEHGVCNMDLIKGDRSE